MDKFCVLQTYSGFVQMVLVLILRSRVTFLKIITLHRNLFLRHFDVTNDYLLVVQDAKTVMSCLIVQWI